MISPVGLHLFSHLWFWEVNNDVCGWAWFECVFAAMWNSKRLMMSVVKANVSVCLWPSRTLMMSMV